MWLFNLLKWIKAKKKKWQQSRYFLILFNWKTTMLENRLGKFEEKQALIVDYLLDFEQVST